MARVIFLWVALLLVSMAAVVLTFGGLLAAWDDHPHCPCNDEAVQRGRIIFRFVIAPLVIFPCQTAFILLRRRLAAFYNGPLPTASTVGKHGRYR